MRVARSASGDLLLPLFTGLRIGIKTGYGRGKLNLYWKCGIEVGAIRPAFDCQVESLEFVIGFRRECTRNSPAFWRHTL